MDQYMELLQARAAEDAQVARRIRRALRRMARARLAFKEAKREWRRARAELRRLEEQRVNDPNEIIVID